MWLVVRIDVGLPKLPFKMYDDRQRLAFNYWLMVCGNIITTGNGAHVFAYYSKKWSAYVIWFDENKNWWPHF